MKICPKCCVSHSKQGVHCSRKCANSRKFTDETNRKRSKSNKKWAIEHPVEIEKFKVCCSNSKCDNVIEVHKYRLKKKLLFCSKKCSDTSGRLKGKCGGYREKAGRGKRGHYKGVYCASTYELAWVIWNIDSKIEFKRFPTHLIYGDNKKYFPDFIVGNKIFEIKGYNVKDITDQKLKSAVEAGYEIELIDKIKIKPYVEYVKGKYRVKNLEELYDTPDH